jgi:hypothetical protein
MKGKRSAKEKGEPSAKDKGEQSANEKGQKSPKDNLQALTQLCAENNDTIGNMVNLLYQINSGPTTDATVREHVGTCTPASGQAFPATEADCRAYPGTWQYDPDADTPTEKLVRKLPHAAKQLNELNEICKDSIELVQKVTGLLKEINQGQPGQMIGVCRLQDGKCFPGTQKACAEAGGIWSYVLPPPAAKKPRK